MPWPLYRIISALIVTVSLTSHIIICVQCKEGPQKTIDGLYTLEAAKHLHRQNVKLITTLV